MTQQTNSTTDERALDRIHSLYSDPHRTAVLETIAERKLPLSLRELARALSDRQIDPGDERDRSRRELAISLHHVHLPSLDAADALTYDPETNTVTEARTAPILAFA